MRGNCASFSLSIFSYDLNLPHSSTKIAIHVLAPFSLTVQLTCGTCEICEEPDDFTGIDVVVQAVALTDTTVSVWFSSSVNVQAAEFASTCLSM